MNPDELAAQLSGRYFASLPEIKTEFSSNGHNVTMSEPEPALLLPVIKSNYVDMSEVEEGNYFILKPSKGPKVYRFVAYKTSKGYYLQEDSGVKNPYQN